MKYRTDLAIESMEGIESEIEGVDIEKVNYDDDITATRIIITDEQGEKIFEKRKGTYTTIEIEGIVDGREGICERAASALSKELKDIVKSREVKNVLVIGLGNDKVTPDALGPYTVSKVRVTRHFITIYGFDVDSGISNVSGLIPGVTGSTGIETAELIKQTVDIVKPDTVIIVDSLAARNIERVNTTIQINNTGISPGSGMGNIRKMLDKETLGCDVIAIGVPTVIDARTLVIDALSGAGRNDDEIEDYLRNSNHDLVVTSTDIDMVIRDFSNIIANGINIMLHPGIYS